MRYRILNIICIALGIAATAFAVGCSPVYTWGYADTIHPVATSAYIRAVMARERGDYARAVSYYDQALKYTDSQSIRAERNEVARMTE